MDFITVGIRRSDLDRVRTAAGNGLPVRRSATALEVLRICVVGAAVACAAAFGSAHEADLRTPVVIDTDLGIDDVVAVAMALQDPDLEVAALVAGEGVADTGTAAEQAARLTVYFNRPDVPVLGAAATRREAVDPAIRRRAAEAIDAALSSVATAEVARLRPGSYPAASRSTTVLVLGPLTRLADALSADPDLASRLGRVVVSGDPEDAGDWNLSADPTALETVRETGVPLTFVRPADRGAKPDDWYTDHLVGGQGTSLGEALLDRLLAESTVREHFMETLASFHDELAVLYLTRPDLFRGIEPGIVEPTNGEAAAAAVAEALSRGRQRKDRVVFIDGPLPAEVLQDDVRARRDAILAANGPDEWFAQLLLNELHEHLGAYSIIGVKMGLRAAELLNAPQHAMAVVSSAPGEQPVSCLNDGLLVSTGSTPGRGLFRHTPGPPGTVAASFTYNGRTITLRLADRYRGQLRTAIGQLLNRYTLEDDEYWEGVRALGLDIWESWHRRDLFEVVASETGEAAP